MARKSRTSPLEDILDLVSMLPWWAGVTLAAVSYVMLHRLATPVQVTAVQPVQIGAFMTQSIIFWVAYMGQYVAPIICFVGAAISFWRRKQRTTLVTDVAQAKSANSLNGMSWREFEILVGEAYRLQGYHVIETGGGGADGGIDLVLTKGNEKFLVQCKQWKAFKVGVDVVRELYGIMAAKGATGGFVVTSGRFTADAQAFADGRNVKLVDGPRLLGLIKQARESVSLAANGASQVVPVSAVAAATSCPVCASEMVKRTAKKGANAGAQFWGCSKYPGCRGTRPI